MGRLCGGSLRDIVIFGTGEFADLAHYYFTTDSSHRVVAFTVDGAYVGTGTFKGLPVVAFEEVEDSFAPAEHGMFVAAGLTGVNRLRAAKVAEAEAKQYRLASYLSSRADVDRHFELKPNTMVMERAGIQPFVDIGRNGAIAKGSSGDCTIPGQRGDLTHDGIDHIVISASLKKRLTADSLTMRVINYTDSDGRPLRGAPHLAMPSDHCPHVVTWTPLRGPGQ